MDRQVYIAQRDTTEVFGADSGPNINFGVLRGRFGS
jgi:hypothetical protein